MESPEPKSYCFNFKWTLKAKDIDQKNLEEFQIVNH